MKYTDGVPSPDIFRLWSGITAISGALERRVWVETSRSVLFPNLFTLLVAPPAVGKTQAINPVEQLWYANAQKFHVAPNNVTKASLIDSLMKADRKLLAPDKSLIEYHTMLIAASEFGVLVPSHDLEFLSVLNYVYDNPKSYREERRTMARSIDISNPQLVILAATQPGYLAATLPEEAWSMGTTSRLIMVYSGTCKHVPLFSKGENRQEEFKALAESLGAMSERVGAFQWDADAAKEIERWYLGGCDPVPEHSKLTHYNGRRILHILKLCMISAMSRSPKLRITLLDLTRAKDWLLAAEATMPDIFKEMVSKSDGQVIQEMHFFMWQIWVKDKKPVHESRIINFLSQRVPSEKIHRVIEIAERSNVISRMAGTQTYTPRPKNSHGLE